jgi:hypothetical protein
MNPLRLGREIYRILQLADGDEWTISKDNLTDSVLVTKIPKEGAPQ